MTVAYDTVTESHGGTSGNTSSASFNWTHTPVGTPRGVLVFVFSGNGSGATSGECTGVTYGGVSMSAVSGGTASDTATEPGTVQSYFLGASIPTGNQTVVVSRNNNAMQVYACCITLTSSGSYDTQLVGTPVLLQENGTFAVQAVDSGSVSALRVAAGYSGGSNVLSAGTGSTSTGANGQIDFGLYTFTTAYETTAGSGSRNVGFSYGTSDDRAGVHLAVTEIIPASAEVSWAQMVVPYAASGDVTVTLTGTSLGLTASRGTLTITGDSNFTLTGSGATASVTSVTVQAGAGVSPTGNALATGLTGVTVTGSASVSPTGPGATATAGSPTITGDSSTTATGSAITAAVGDVTVSTGTDVQVDLTGGALTASVTAPTVTGSATVSPTGTGLAASVTAPTVTGGATVNATGTGLAASVADVSVTTGIQVDLTGNGLAAGLTTLTVTGSASVSPTGTGLAATAGDVTVSTDGGIVVNLTGSAMTASVGDVSVTTTGEAEQPVGGSGRSIGYHAPLKLPKKQTLVVKWTDDHERELAELLRKVDTEYEAKRAEQYAELLELIRQALGLSREIALSGFEYLTEQDFYEAKRKIQQEEEAIILLLVA
jgi:hypothetical protein